MIDQAEPAMPDSIANWRGEFLEAAEKHSTRRWSWSRRVLAGVLGLLAVGVIVVSPIGAVSAVDDLASKFSSTFSGDDPVGEQLTSYEHLPPWLTDDGASGQRILTSEGGHSLSVSTDSEGQVTFGLDRAVGIGDSKEGWAERLSSSYVELLGPVLPQDGRVAVFGLSAEHVARVVITYDEGPPVAVKPENGGFIVLLDPDRGEPESLEAVSADGSVIQSKPLPRLFQ